MATRRSHDGEQGFSLVELLVVVLILGLVLAAFQSSFISAQRSNSRLDARMEQLGQGQGLIRSATRDLRAATAITDGGSAFVFAGAREVTYYAYLGTRGGATNSAGFPVPVKVRLFVDQTTPSQPTLMQSITAPDNPSATPPTYTGARPPVVQNLGMYVTNAASRPLFRYYDVGGAEVVPPAPGASLTALQQLSVRSVGIELSVKRPTNRDVTATTIRARVILPNVVYSVAPGV